MSGPFYEIVVILGIAAVLGAVGLVLRQPLIVAFLATGILVGPSGLSLVQSDDQIDVLARIGISLLLFVVGLRLDLHLIRTTGPVALATGIGQVVFTSLIGFLLCLLLGFPVIPSLYIAVALTFSSTIIIVKLLSDKKELGSLHGRIALGFLIVQDIVAILAMIILVAVGGGATDESSALSGIISIAAKGIAFLISMGLLARYVLPGLTMRLAANQELLVLFAIAWAVFVGSAGQYLGLSKEVGAFVAGVSLASTPYRDAIAARLVSVRDFLLLFFFIDLGARLKLDMVGPQLLNSIYLSLFVLVGNPIIVLAIMGYMGYRRRTGFMAGLTVAQISEFSLILGALGVSLGHMGMEAMSLITLVGVITICISTYMIIYSGVIYRWISSPLRIFERRHPHREETEPETCVTPDIETVLIGLGNYGSGIAEHLLQRKRRLVGVDFDPQALALWRSRGVPVIFGDVGDPEFFDILPLDCSAWVVSTVRDRQLNLALLHILAERRYKGKTAVTAQDEEETEVYRATGAHVVLQPFSDAAEEAVDSLMETMHLLPTGIDWPLAIEEVKLRKGSVFAGQLIRDLDFRKATGISIIAVSRAGRLYLHPDPEFQLFPADRLVLMGEPDAIRIAEDLLQQLPEDLPDPEHRRFTIAEVEVYDHVEDLGKTLEEIRFRQRHGVTVVGIIRQGQRITAPSPQERILSGDRLIVIGTPDSVAKLRSHGQAG